MGKNPSPFLYLITEIIVDINDDYVGDRLINRSTAITRTSVPFMDEKLGWELPVLDHGFIRILDYLGDDHAIDSAARMSYGEGTKRKNEAQGLINYLMGHHHTSPFEMCEIKLHVKLPIFVARQWIRHRTSSAIARSLGRPRRRWGVRSRFRTRRKPFAAAMDSSAGTVHSPGSSQLRR